jgi:SAM-dependent methyltransferase
LHAVRTEVLDARGHLEKAQFVGDQVLQIIGWMFRLGQRFERIAVSIDGRPAADGAVVPRADVAAAHPWLTEAARAGLAANVPYSWSKDSWHVLTVTGLSGQQAVARLELEFRADYDTRFTTPPVHLMERVTQIRDATLFKLDGLRTLRDMLRGIEAQLPSAGSAHWLDWGCGCGRVTAPLRDRLREAKISACDVDGEAVAWCRESVEGVSFDTIAPAPPTRYAAASVDVIMAYSIFTHLPGQRQLDWLRECRRLLRPGGHLLATVHGWDAARIVGRPPIVAQLQAHGISDETVDPNLDGVLAPGEYRSVFQAEEYTRRVWGQELELVDYVPHGSNGFQDLVVLRA